MIDWTVFDQYPENTLTCACGHVFRSHSKYVRDPEPHIHSRKSCPGCGFQDRIVRASSDPEEFVIGRKP